jgi:hypothetical protein
MRTTRASGLRGAAALAALAILAIVIAGAFAERKPSRSDRDDPRSAAVRATAGRGEHVAGHGEVFSLSIAQTLTVGARTGSPVTADATLTRALVEENERERVFAYSLSDRSGVLDPVDLAEPFFVITDVRGIPRAAAFAEGTSTSARRIAKLVVAHTQFASSEAKAAPVRSDGPARGEAQVSPADAQVAPTRGEARFETRELDATGTYVATYTRTDRGWRREKRVYEELAGAIAAPEIAGATDIELDEHGELRSLVTRETIVTRPREDESSRDDAGSRDDARPQIDAPSSDTRARADASSRVEARSRDEAASRDPRPRDDASRTIAGVAIRSELAVDLIRTGTARVDLAELRAMLARATREDLAPGFDAASARRRSDETITRGAGFDELRAELLAGLALSDEQKRHEAGQQAVFRLGALFRLEPDEVARAKARVLASDATLVEVAVMTAGLGAANTGPATAALVEILDAPASGEVHAQAAIALGLGGVVTADAVRALDTAASREPGDLQGAATLALGLLAQRRASDSPDIVATLLARYHASQSVDERALLFEALANSGDARILPVIDVLLGGANLEQQVAAAYGLRFVAGSESDERLRRLLALHGVPAVREAAARAVAHRDLAAWLPLLRSLLGTERDPDVLAVLQQTLAQA